MLSIDEAIARERNLAEIYRNDIVPKEDYHNMPWIDMENESNMRIAKEHEQLAEWLEELKAYREIGTVEECRNNILDILKAYNKAIDDVGKALLNEIYTQNIKMIIYGDGIDTLDTQISPYKLWDNIAEQLKEQNK